MNLLRPLAAALLTLSAFGANAVAVYNLQNQFSGINNPSGVWTYGETNGFGGLFTKFTSHAPLNPGLDNWNSATAVSFTPIVYHNKTAAPISLGTPLYGPNEAGFHPGPGNRDATYRFTAPLTSQYTFSGSFFGQDTRGTTTDVGLFLNSVQQGSLINVTGFGLPSLQTRLSTFTLAAGNTLDISVGNRGNFNFDSTGLSVTITQLDPAVVSGVPEPQSVALMLAGLVAVGFVTKRRKD